MNTHSAPQSPQLVGGFFKQWKTARVITVRFLMISSAALILSNCGAGSCRNVTICGDGGGGNPGDNSGNPAPTPPPKVGSSGSASGSVGVYTNNGATYVLTPGAAGREGTVNLLILPNTGSAVGAITVTQVQTTLKDSLNNPAAISGTSVDPANDVGMAFNYYISQISFFKLSTAKEITTYDTLTTNTMGFSGASGVKIAGAIMNPADKTMILATGDGFETLDYTDPAAPVKIREIPSFQKDAANGVEIMENFAFDPALPIGDVNYAMVITGGGQNGPDHVMELVDAGTGQVYHPDAATVALLPLTNYIDAAAVDTTYHVVVMAEEGASSTYFIDLKAATLDASAGTYNLPKVAVGHISKSKYFKYTNLAIESTNHLVMMGKEDSCGSGGSGGTSTVIGLLEDPSVALGFVYDAQVTMPTDTDDLGNTVTWNGWCDPHGAVAYLSTASMGLWLNASADHVAVINLQNVLNGTRLLSGSYDSTATTPKDIEYFAIP